MNSLEKFHLLHIPTKHSNEIPFYHQNPIFDTLYRHHINKETPSHQMALPYVHYKTRRHQTF
jgi:hypothetical protein